MCEKPQVTKHTQEENVLLAETRNLDMFSPACRTAFSYIYLNILWKKKKPFKYQIQTNKEECLKRPVSSWSLLNVPASEEMVWGIMTVTSCPVRSVLRPWHSVYFEKDLVCWLSQTSHGFNSMPGASTAKWRTSKHLLICWAALSSNSCSLTYCKVGRNFD